MSRFSTKSLLLGLAITASSIVGLEASVVVPVPIETRARGADRVVVGTVDNVTTRYERNRFGDELIVSHAHVRIQEALKGGTADVTVVIEGGTLNGMTLRVSDLPSVSPGDRGVFFLTSRTDGEYKPHLRGQGILKLDSTDHVRGTNLTLGDVRRLTAAGR